jgi:hypothetical protein
MKHLDPIPVGDGEEGEPPLSGQRGKIGERARVGALDAKHLAGTQPVERARGFVDG